MKQFKMSASLDWYKGNSAFSFLFWIRPSCSDFISVWFSDVFKYTSDSVCVCVCLSFSFSLYSESMQNSTNPVELRWVECHLFRFQIRGRIVGHAVSKVHCWHQQMVLCSILWLHISTRVIFEQENYLKFLVQFLSWDKCLWN